MSSARSDSNALHWGLSRIDALMMAVVVVAISSSGPIIALSTAPVLAMATWRCILGSAATFPLAYRNQGLAKLNRDQLRGCIFAGLALGVHFALWIPSVRLTSVANSVALVATQPIWMLLMNKRLGHQIPRRVWWGIVVAIIGVLTVVGVDFGNLNTVIAVARNRGIDVICKCPEHWQFILQTLQRNWRLIAADHLKLGKFINCSGDGVISLNLTGLHNSASFNSSI